MSAVSYIGSPVRNWVSRLTNAVALSAFATVDLRAEPGPRMVSLVQLATIAERDFQGRAGWGELGSHLQALKPLGVDTLALRARRRQIDMVLGRSDRHLSMQSLNAYFQGVELWYRAFHDLLPRLKVDDREAAAVASLGERAGETAGPVLSRLLTALIEAGGGGTAVTVHPVAQAGNFAQAFAKTDLTSLPAVGIANRNWLWDIGTGRLIEAAGTNDFGIGPPISAKDLGIALAATDG